MHRYYIFDTMTDNTVGHQDVHQPVLPAALCERALRENDTAKRTRFVVCTPAQYPSIKELVTSRKIRDLPYSNWATS